MFIIYLVIVVLVVVFVISKYNWMVQMKNNRQNAFADIDVQLQLRFDLVPNLVNTVKGYATQEQAIYDKIMESRKLYSAAPTIDSKLSINNEFMWALWKLLAISESNPEIKSNANFMQMQSDLSDIENKLAASRRFFNSATNEYNTYIQSFPANIIAWAFWFLVASSYEIENKEEVAKAPEVKF